MTDFFKPFTTASDKECPQCRCTTVLVSPTDTKHYGKQTCANGDCGAFRGWHPKPKPEGQNTRTDTKKLVEKYGRGFCEMCLRKTKFLPSGTSFEAHHVVEKKDGGDESRLNIWVLCTMCHRQIHHNRTYLGHYDSMFQHHLDQIA